MYLQKLHIQNFRCFKDYEIDFAPKVTVLFGKNGSGKSTLIHALHKVLSFTMHSIIIKEKSGTAKRPKVIDILDITDGNPYVCVEGFAKYGDEHYKGVKRDDYTIDIHAEAVLNHQKTIEWSISTYYMNGGKRPSLYKQAFMDLYEEFKQTGTRPLLAFYSDMFPFQKSKRTVPQKEKSKRTYILSSTNPGMAYTDWNSEAGMTNVWIERLESKIRNRLQLVARNMIGNQPGINDSEEEKHKYEQESKEIEHEINAITDCLRRFSANTIGGIPLHVQDLNFSKQDMHLHVYLTEGEPIAFRQLPAGYLRLYSIVLDLAYRSYILSGRTTTNVPGIALIDEIDLHLHPALEQSVLQSLQNTFPSIQFIISTHSPLVLSSVENKPENIVYCMHTDGDARTLQVHHTYGLDANLLMEENMEANNRTPAISSKIGVIEECISAKDIDKAKALMNELEQETDSSQTTLVRLRAIINRLEIIGR